MWDKFIQWLHEKLIGECEYDTVARQWRIQSFNEQERPKLKSDIEDLREL